MLINKDLIDLTSESAHFWSGTVYNADKALFIRTDYGTRISTNKAVKQYVRCVKR